MIYVYLIVAGTLLALGFCALCACMLSSQITQEAGHGDEGSPE